MIRVTSPRSWIALGARPGGVQRAATNGADGLERLKRVARAKFHELARKLHPDLGGSDADEQRLKALTVAHDEIQALVYRPPPPLRPQWRPIFTGPFTSTDASTATQGVSYIRIVFT